DNKDVVTEVTTKSEIARTPFIQQEDDLDSEVDGAEGVPGVSSDGSNSLKTVNDNEDDDLVVDDIKSKFGKVIVVDDVVESCVVSSKRRRVYKVVSDDADLVVDDNMVIKLDDIMSHPFTRKLNCVKTEKRHRTRSVIGY
ncbi:hypothetical protein Tco_1535148, partial [Tanacetum coccineum]